MVAGGGLRSDGRLIPIQERVLYPALRPPLHIGPGAVNFPGPRTLGQRKGRMDCPSALVLNPLSRLLLGVLRQRRFAVYVLELFVKRKVVRGHISFVIVVTLFVESRYPSVLSIAAAATCEVPSILCA